MESDLEQAGASLPRRDGRRRVVILAVRPSVDGGAYPVKRVLGDALEVEADVICDGHDVIDAVLMHRHVSEGAWREAPLEARTNDVFRGSAPLDRLGRHWYCVLAWVDAFKTFRRGLLRKLEARQDVSVELLEGALLVQAAAARAQGEDARVLGTWGTMLGVRDAPQSERARLASSDELERVMRRHPDRALASSSEPLVVDVEPKLAEFSSWYELFPRSAADAERHGTFEDVQARLEYVARMGFDVLYLPPIHPIGLAYRKGPDNTPEAGPSDPGSPWAIGAVEGGHTSVHPALGTLQDFERLVRRARELGIEVALDIALQASPDHPWVLEHPEWFKHRADGSIQYAENPPKKYQDVYPFDFECAAWESLWQALRGIFSFWVARGVRVFRVDNPHTKPIGFWAWCIRTLRDQNPELIFLAEAFTRPKLMYALAKGGFSQSYTYFTWRSTGPELEHYLDELCKTDVVQYFRPNFWPTTPDIFPEQLHHARPAAFVIRAILAGTLASNYGIYGPSYELMENVPRAGSEELAGNEKYQLRRWDVSRPENLSGVLTRLNRARRAEAALQANHGLVFHRSSNALVLCYSKCSRGGASVVLVVVNLDPLHAHSAWLELDLEALGIGADETFQVHDQLSDERYLFRGAKNYVELDPEKMPAHLFAVRRRLRTENQFEYFL